MKIPKKFIFLIGAAGILVLAGILAAGLLLTRGSRKNFPAGGYILKTVSEAAGQTARTLTFSAGEEYRGKFPASIVFRDMNGEKNTVGEESFIHYGDGSFSAFVDGMIVNMSEVGQGFLEFYRIGGGMVMEKSADGWRIDSNGHEVAFPEFLWQLSEDKVLAASDAMTLTLPDGEREEISGYVEIFWTDKDIVQVAWPDEARQTVAYGGKVTFQSGAELDFAEKCVYRADGASSFTLSELQADKDNAAGGAITLQSKSAVSWVMPTFHIYNDDGENGTNGRDGADGTEGETGTEGIAGTDGEAGTDGTDGQFGIAGSSGAAGAAGATGSYGGDDGEIGAGVVQASIRISSLSYSSSGVDVGLTVDDANNKLVSGTCFVEIREAATNRLVGSGYYKNSVLSFDDILEPDTEYIVTATSQYEMDLESGSTTIITKTFDTKNFFTSSEGLSLEADYAEENGVYLLLKKVSGVSQSAKYFRLRVTCGNEAADFPSDDEGCGTVSEYVGDEPFFLNLQELLGESYASNVPYSIELYLSDSSNSDHDWTWTATTDTDGKVTEEGYYGLGDTIRKSTQILQGRTLKAAPKLGEVRYTAGEGYYDFFMNVEEDKDSSITGYEFVIFWEENDDITAVRTVTSTANTARWYCGSLLKGAYQVKVRVTYNDNEKDTLIETAAVTFYVTEEKDADVKLLAEDGTEGGSVTGSSIKGNLSIDTSGWSKRSLKSGSSIIVTVSAAAALEDGTSYSYRKSYSLPVDGHLQDKTYLWTGAVDCPDLKPGIPYTITVSGIIVTANTTQDGDIVTEESSEILGVLYVTTKSS